MAEPTNIMPSATATEAASQPREGDETAERAAFEAWAADHWPNMRMWPEAAWQGWFGRAALTQRPPEQAGAVPAADLALTKAIRFTAYNRADPLAIRFEFADDTDRLEAADEIDVILSEAFAQARARMATALAEARIDRDGPAKVRVKPAAPTPPDAGPGEIPAGIPVNVTMLGQCDHLWAYAPTVGNYSCVRCGRRVEHGTAEHQAITATLTPKAPPQTPPDAGIGSDGTALGEVQCHCSEDDGVPDVGVSVGLGCGRALWIGELLTADGATCGMVFHGPNRQRIVAPFAADTDWQEVADIMRHHVGPALATQPGDGGQA